MQSTGDGRFGPPTPPTPHEKKTFTYLDQNKDDA